MTQITILTAAATAVLGYDLLSSGAGARHKTSSGNRWLTAIGVAGSAVAQDFSADLYVGTRNCGTFFNTTGGAGKVPTANADMKPLRIPIPAGAPVSLVVSDAAATEIVAVTLDFAP